MAKLLGIAWRETTRAPLQVAQAAGVSVERGVEADFRGAARNRQVTLLSLSDWQAACADIGVELPWTTRRSNLLVDHLNWAELVGRRLQVGAVVLEIKVEIEPCSRMEAAHAGLQQALVPNWRGGAGCTVIEPGRIEQGDAVALLD
ncbi:MAG: MOSC domain-containing protein [Pseudomonadota bacterium]